MKRLLNVAVSCAGTLALAAHAVEAQQYPAKPVRLMVGFAPGGATDIAARAVAQKLTEILKQPVIVDNRPGASGNLAADLLARAAPDGYSVLLANATIAIPSLFVSLPFDVTKDFAPVSLVGAGPSALVVHPSLPVRKVPELIALAKKRPGELNYASGGTGNITHLAMVLFNSMTSTDMTHIPYKGGGPSTVATLSGETQLMFSSVASTLPHIKQGRLRALGVSSARRSLALPELPTVAEAGLPGYEAASWYGLMLPAATPGPIVERLSADTAKAVESADLKSRLVAQGFEPMPGGAQEFSRYLRSEMSKWAKVIKDARIPPQ
ncbi:MAG: tripartite tricarboxylate transporter substrate binding protein [Burkholderiales bacterium]|nr:tripartite tricarboxylate transporter substrate binding protein [Burkholderiales bacterium]